MFSISLPSELGKAVSPLVAGTLSAKALLRDLASVSWVSQVLLSHGLPWGSCTSKSGIWPHNFLAIVGEQLF